MCGLLHMTFFQRGAGHCAVCPLPLPRFPLSKLADTYSFICFPLGFSLSYHVIRLIHIRLKMFPVPNIKLKT